MRENFDGYCVTESKKETERKRFPTRSPRLCVRIHTLDKLRVLT